MIGHCPNCDAEKKVVVPLHDNHPNICPDCGADMVPAFPEIVQPIGIVNGQRFEVK